MSSGPWEDSNQTTFSSGTPHFFKIILEEALLENKLRIPQRFVRKYGGTLSNSVFVKLPCGSKFKMQLTKEEDNIWFEKGWPDFVNHYSIKRGSMITFRYEGNSEFHAVIFDTSTVEIDYPSIPVDFDRSGIDLDLQVSTEKVVEISDDLSPCPKAREKSPLPCSQPNKRMRKRPNGETQRNSSDPISKGSSHSEFSMRKENLQSSEPEMTAAKSDRDETTTRSQRIKRIHSHLKPPINTSENVAPSPFQARVLESRRPSFQVVIQPSYLYCGFLCFSPEFARRHLINKSSDATLIVSSGKRRTWSVTYSLKVHKRPSARLQSGWSAFALDNNLEEDPEEILTNETQPGSSLDNFPGKEACMSTPWKRKKALLSNIQRARILERVPFESDKPFFKIFMQPTYVDYMNDVLYLPLDFAIRYIKDQGDVVLSVTNGRYWSAKFKMKPLSFKRRIPRICNGWNQFVKGNNLEVGDVCIFKLLDETEISFEVSIVRFDEYECGQWSQAGDDASGASKPMGDVRVKIEID